MVDSEIPMQSETWNNAKGFSTYHVLFPLIECRKLVKICLFGVEEIEQQGAFSPQQINDNKINAINRLLQELMQLVEDNAFVMDTKTKEIMDKLKKRLGKVEEVIDGISRVSIDQRIGQKQTILNEKHFKLCLNELRSVLSEIKKPLNIKNLIFPASDELDLDKIKQEIIEGG